MTIRWLSTLLLLLLSLSGCNSGPKQPTIEPDLVAVLKTRPSLQQFARALDETGVAASLRREGNYTIFAPMDVATRGQALDQATIRHHILPERVTFSDLAGENTSYTTLHNDEIEIDATETIRIGDGLMVESDIAAANGVIHVIDKVLEPSSDVPRSLNPSALAAPTELAPPVELAVPDRSTEERDGNIIPAAPTTAQ